MMFDEINNDCWYSFIFEPDAKLKKIKKNDIQEQLSFVSDDLTLESFHEVDKDTNEFIKVSAYFNKFLNKLYNLFKQCGLNYVIVYQLLFKRSSKSLIC